MQNLHASSSTFWAWVVTIKGSDLFETVPLFPWHAVNFTSMDLADLRIKGAS
jgi:hypothetical protein